MEVPGECISLYCEYIEGTKWYTLQGVLRFSMLNLYNFFMCHCVSRYLLMCDILCQVVGISFLKELLILTVSDVPSVHRTEKGL